MAYKADMLQIYTIERSHQDSEGGKYPWSLILLSCHHLPCDEDCKVIVCWMAFSHIQYTLKPAEVVGKDARFSCSCKSCLREGWVRRIRGAYLGKQGVKSNIHANKHDVEVCYTRYIFVIKCINKSTCVCSLWSTAKPRNGHRKVRNNWGCCG